MEVRPLVCGKVRRQSQPLQRFLEIRLGILSKVSFEQYFRKSREHHGVGLTVWILGE